MTGNEAIYRVAMARPTPEHGSASRSIFVALLLLGIMAAAVIAVPQFIN